MAALTTAELAIYAILIIPTLFILFKHGKPGLLGWIYLAVFCSLRIIGGAMFLSHSSAANIVSNIGLSPLLLSTAGILHEAQHYRKKTSKLKMIKILLFHIVVTGGIAILATGLSGLQSDSPTPDDQSKVKAGLGILTASWVLLVIQTLYIMFLDGFAPLDNRHLLVSLIIGLTFIGIRVVYTLVALTSNNPDLNPTTDTLAIRVVLSFLPELIAAILYIIAGILTRNLRSEDKRQRKPSEPSYTLA
ncbi:C6 zinc finger domain protein [Fusarium austroafricanum]|uniref:C6 zinc finger domain protein n=1 Tax=Fusarium austroafricanum TaxID=2364996 RepID=A0A8H4P4H6_9HYPO|nr:C6 zinc finger domain protein [Fusarium austroafricanum]